LIKEQYKNLKEKLKKQKELYQVLMKLKSKLKVYMMDLIWVKF